MSTPETPKTEAAGLSRKKRLALISYLAILFIVALAVVTLSLVIQIHRDTEKNTTIAERAYALQEENEQFEAQIESQADEIDALQEEAEELRTNSESLQAEVDRLTEENTQLSGEIDGLNTQLENTQKAFDLLLKAEAAYVAEDAKSFIDLMDELAPLAEQLPEEAAAEYNTLVAALATIETAPPEGD